MKINHKKLKKSSIFLKYPYLCTVSTIILILLLVDSIYAISADIYEKKREFKVVEIPKVIMETVEVPTYIVGGSVSNLAEDMYNIYKRERFAYTYQLHPFLRLMKQNSEVDKYDTYLDFVLHKPELSPEEEETLVLAASEMQTNEAELCEFYSDIPLPREIQYYLYQRCQERNIDFKIMLGVIKKESNFDPKCKSYNENSYDAGLCQVNSGNFDWMKKVFGDDWDVWDIYNNIDAGVFIMSCANNTAEGDTHKMLMVYNQGANGAKKSWKKGNYTSAYSKAVVKFAESLPLLDFEIE